MRMTSYASKTITGASDMTSMRQVWAYRGFVFGTVKREFKLKYQRSLLGAAWVVLNPLAMIVIYTVIFAQVMQARLPGVDSTFAYSIFLCAGITTWGLFSEIVNRSQNLFLDNANLIKKLNFPRVCLPIAVVITAVINFGIVFGLFLLFLVVTGNFPGWPIVALLPLLLILIGFAIGLGMVVGVLNVFFRDVGQFFGLFLNFWFWGTPIVYSPNILPAALKPYAQLNPMTGLVTSFQEILVNGAWPHWVQVVPVAILTVFVCVLAFALFTRAEGELVDEL